MEGLNKKEESKVEKLDEDQLKKLLLERLGISSTEKIKINISDKEISPEETFSCDSGAVDVDHDQEHIEVFSLKNKNDLESLNVVGGSRWSRGNHDHFDYESTPLYKVAKGDEEYFVIVNNIYGKEIDDYNVEVFKSPDFKKFKEELEKKDINRWEKAGILNIRNIVANNYENYCKLFSEVENLRTKIYEVGKGSIYVTEEQAPLFKEMFEKEKELRKLSPVNLDPIAISFGKDINLSEFSCESYDESTNMGVDYRKDIVYGIDNKKIITLFDTDNYTDEDNYGNTTYETIHLKDIKGIKKYSYIVDEYHQKRSFPHQQPTEDDAYTLHKIIK